MHVLPPSIVDTFSQARMDYEKAVFISRLVLRELAKRENKS
jgi:hypothetical protein